MPKQQISTAAEPISEIVFDGSSLSTLPKSTPEAGSSSTGNMAVILSPQPQSTPSEPLKPSVLLPRTVFSSPQKSHQSFSIAPRQGSLQTLRTKGEVEACLVLVPTSVIRVGVRDAHAVMKLLDGACSSSTPSMNHLRRVAKPKDLSPSLLAKLDYTPPPPCPRTRSSSSSTNSGRSNRSSRSNSSTSSRSSGTTPPAPIFVLGVPISALPQATVQSIISDYAALKSSSKPRLGPQKLPIYSVHTLDVPLTPPSTPVEATEWSEAYWPAVHRVHNPFGPQPSMWARAEVGVKERAGVYMALARQLASEADGRGEAVGAVIVDRSAFAVTSTMGAIVAVASDARRLPPFDSSTGNGNPMAHAALRAIALVAAQRVALARGAFPTASSVLQDGPLSDLERTLCHWDSPEKITLKEGGYLCTGLDIYLTHEPCVACCMALLHSRFARAVFWKRMDGTGGLSAEGRCCDAESKPNDASKGTESKPTTIEKNGTGSNPGKKAINGVISKLKDNATNGAKGGEVQKETEGGQQHNSGYGLWHRQELNWRMMAWQWVDEQPGNEHEGSVFHA